MPRAQYLLSWASVSPCRKGQENRVSQECKVGLESWRTQPCPKVNRKCTLHQSADEMTESSGQRILLTTGLDLIQLHLQRGHSCGHSDTFLLVTIHDYFINVYFM